MCNIDALRQLVADQMIDALKIKTKTQKHVNKESDACRYYVIDKYTIKYGTLQHLHARQIRRI